jgi:3-isopropylmalate dehydrogenase
MMRHTFNLEKEAETIEVGVLSTLEGGFRTADLARSGERIVSTEDMGHQIAEFVRMAAMTTAR